MMGSNGVPVEVEVEVKAAVEVSSGVSRCATINSGRSHAA